MRVSELLGDEAAKQLAAAIESLLDENIPACDKQLSIQSFDRAVNQRELYKAWSYLGSRYRAQYKYWLTGQGND